jgi:hypothetical protein
VQTQPRGVATGGRNRVIRGTEQGTLDLHVPIQAQQFETESNLWINIAPNIHRQILTNSMRLSKKQRNIREWYSTSSLTENKILMNYVKSSFNDKGAKLLF